MARMDRARRYDLLTMMTPVSLAGETGVYEGASADEQRHRPSPEGFHGGANGEVSWLRAFARLPGDPVAS
jgi:hypothetical protein